MRFNWDLVCLRGIKGSARLFLHRARAFSTLAAFCVAGTSAGASTVTLTSSANPAVQGQPVAFLVSVSGATPTGTVTFYDGATAIVGCTSILLTTGNPATSSCSPPVPLAVGHHLITAEYSGDGNNTPARMALSERVLLTASGTVPTLSAGSYHVCSVAATGTPTCWGANNYGAVGDGTLINRALPVAVSGLASVTTIATGDNHTCASTSVGGARCWGYNYYGQLGNGASVDSAVPVDVLGLSGVIALTGGANHSCALLSTGSVHCWGANSSGQLGIGSNVAQTSPVAVTGLSGSVLAIDAGGNQTCALLATGSLMCWGAGRMGDGTTTARNVPTAVSGLSGSVASVSVGSSNICALLVGGAVQCWGSNGSGQLGDGTVVARLLPINVSGLGSATGLSTSGASTCAILTDGSAKCWGSGNYGKLGIGVVTTPNPTPQSVVGFTSGIADIAVGGTFTCAVTTGGSIRCWGRNTEGELGNGSYGVQRTPADATGVPTGQVSIAAGGFHACTLSASHNLSCWGGRSSGAVGDGVVSIAAQTSAAAVSVLGSTVAQVATGISHSCAVTTLGGLKCWGDNFWGELGDGTTTTRGAPGDVSGLTTGVRSVSAGTQHTCAVTTSGAAKCWGQNQNGQLGNGTTSTSTTSAMSPVDVTGLASGVVALSAGSGFTCALLDTGGVKCWGGNFSGQLGDGTTTNRPLPTDVVGLSSGVTAISAGGDSACALLSSGTVKCWGDNSTGALGDGGVVGSSAVPVDTMPLGAEATTVSVGFSFACARLASGGAECWGYNRFGQLGNGSLVDSATPVFPTGLSSGVAAISAGAQFTCVIMNSGGTKCWGDNQAGQMGNGTVGYEVTASRYVAMPSLTRPLSVSDKSSVTASVDGAIIARYLAGITGSAVPQGVDMTAALRSDPTELRQYLDAIRPLLDIDGDTEFNATTDGLLLTRYLLGLRGAALVVGAVGRNATRDAAAIQTYLSGLLP